MSLARPGICGTKTYVIYKRNSDLKAHPPPKMVARKWVHISKEQYARKVLLILKRFHL